MAAVSAIGVRVLRQAFAVGSLRVEQRLTRLGMAGMGVPSRRVPGAGAGLPRSIAQAVMALEAAQLMASSAVAISAGVMAADAGRALFGWRPSAVSLSALLLPVLLLLVVPLLLLLLEPLLLLLLVPLLLLLLVPLLLLLLVPLLLLPLSSRLLPVISRS